MGYARKIDKNQPAVVKNLRRIGCSVRVLSMVGKGFPDLVVGWKGVNYLFELKDENNIQSKKQLTPDEQEFFDTWRGSVHKVESLDDILKIINGNQKF